MFARTRLLAGAAALTLACGATPTIAGEAPGSGGPPAVAALAPWTLAAVPAAISEFDEDDFYADDITDTLELFRYVPNGFAAKNIGLGSANGYFIRGLGSIASIATVDPAVGTYVDGVYIPRQNGDDFQLLDVARVDVRRGPQGVLFGRNTTGGAIDIALAGPSDTFSGTIDGGYGRFHRKLLRGAINLPLTEIFALRLSGFVQDSDGHAKNLTTGERLNSEDSAGLRAAARLQAAPNLAWKLAIAYVRDERSNLLDFECDAASPDGCQGRFATTGLRAQFPGEDSQFAPLPISGRKAGFDLGNRTDTRLVTSTLDWGDANRKLSLVTGFVDLKQKYAVDFLDGREAPSLLAPMPPVRGFARGGFSVVNDSRHRQFSQEARLSGKLLGGALDYVAGVSYSDEDNDTDFADVATVPTAAPAPADQLPLLLADRRILNGARAWAGYAQIDAHASDRLTLTAGVRYTDEKDRFSVSDESPGCASGGADCLDDGNLTAPNGQPIPRTQRAKIWTPRIAASFRPSEDVLLFASATRGYRSGGWNGRAENPAGLLPFGPETAWSYEAGLKGDWFGHRLRVGLTGFWLDVGNMQVASSGGAGALPEFAVDNVAGYRNRGVELEIAAEPLAGLNTYLNLGWQHDEYRIDGDAPATGAFGEPSVAAQRADCLAELAAGRIPGANGADDAPSCGAGIVTASGDIASPVHTPDLSLAAGAAYDIVLPPYAGAIVTPSIDVFYQAESEVGAANRSLFLGSVTGPGGAVYPANPFAGDFIGGSRSKAHVLVAARLAVRTDDDAWLLSVGCDNCLDETYVQSSFANFSYLNPPRIWSIRARRKF